MEYRDLVVFGIIEMPGKGKKEKKVVLIADSDKPAPRFYKFPGGRVRANENAEIALFREIVEEVGINIDKNVTQVATMDKKSHKIIFFCCKYYCGKIKPGQEVAEVLLLSQAEIQKMITDGKVLPNHAEAFRKYIELK
jgi:ADP-ribose pyrophosphatase YjhB (NUDIX family)